MTSVAIVIAAAVALAVILARDGSHVATANTDATVSQTTVSQTTVSQTTVTTSIAATATTALAEVADTGTSQPSDTGPDQDTAPASTSLTVAPSGPVEEFLRVWSTNAVSGGAIAPTTFTIDQAWQVTEIVTYHWNKGRGAPPGTIGLRAAGGKVYGPWRAVELEGSGPRAWLVNPNIIIPPGEYTVVDSDPGTWSQNGDTNGAGMTWGKGIRQGNP